MDRNSTQHTLTWRQRDAGLWCTDRISFLSASIYRPSDHFLSSKNLPNPVRRQCTVYLECQALARHGSLSSRWIYPRTQVIPVHELSTRLRVHAPFLRIWCARAPIACLGESIVQHFVHVSFLTANGKSMEIVLFVGFSRHTMIHSVTLERLFSTILFVIWFTMKTGWLDNSFGHFSNLPSIRSLRCLSISLAFSDTKREKYIEKPCTVLVRSMCFTKTTLCAISNFGGQFSAA